MQGMNPSRITDHLFQVIFWIIIAGVGLGFLLGMCLIMA